MFKQISLLEVKGSGDRLHRFECDPSTPPGEVYDALCAMSKFVLDSMQKEAKKDEQKVESKEECNVEKN